MVIVFLEVYTKNPVGCQRDSIRNRQRRKGKGGKGRRKGKGGQEMSGGGKGREERKGEVRRREEEKRRGGEDERRKGGGERRREAEDPFSPLNTSEVLTLNNPVLLSSEPSPTTVRGQKTLGRAVHLTDPEL